MAGLDDLKNERSFLMHGNLLLKMDHFLDESATFAGLSTSRPSTFCYRSLWTRLTREWYQNLDHSNVSPPVENSMITASSSCYEFLIAWGICSIWDDSRTWDCLCSNQSGSILFLLKMNFLFQFKTELLFLIFRNKNKISDPPR